MLFSMDFITFMTTYPLGQKCFGVHTWAFPHGDYFNSMLRIHLLQYGYSKKNVHHSQLYNATMPINRFNQPTINTINYFTLTFSFMVLHIYLVTFNASFFIPMGWVQHLFWSQINHCFPTKQGMPFNSIKPHG